MFFDELYKLLSAVPPDAYAAVGEILKEILNHDDPRVSVRHAEVLAAKARLGLLK